MHALLGFTILTEDEYDKALNTYKTDLRFLNKALENKDFFVGSNITIADIVIFSHNFVAMQIVFDEEFR